MSCYIVELRIRESGDVGDELPVSALIELPGDGMRRVVRRQSATVGAAVGWCFVRAVEWLRGRK